MRNLANHTTTLLPSLVCLLLLFASCSTEHRAFSPSLPDGLYRIKEGDGWKKAQVYTEEDSTYLVFDTTAPPVAASDYLRLTGKKLLVRNSLDLDVFSLPVKFRPSQQDIPHQLNAHFNGNFYVGYRTSRYLYGQKRMAPGAVQRYRHHISYGAGAFGGVGSVFINPTFVRDAIAYEYDGVVLSYGVATMIGYGKISTGLCLGFDHLADRYRRYWIYQNKPWLGLVVGFHLN